MVGVAATTIKAAMIEDAIGSTGDLDCAQDPIVQVIAYQDLLTMIFRLYYRNRLNLLKKKWRILSWSHQSLSVLLMKCRKIRQKKKNCIFSLTNGLLLYVIICDDKSTIICFPYRLMH